LRTSLLAVRAILSSLTTHARFQIQPFNFNVTADNSCMRKKTFDEIVSVQLIDYIHLLDGGYDNFLPWLPLIAPELMGGLQSNPLQAFRDGTFHDIPVIIGSVMNETDAWIPQSLNHTTEVRLTRAASFLVPSSTPARSS
jgi:hypothetical protein